jgi:hypothetical protein
MIRNEMVKETLRERAIESVAALKATAIHRGTSEQIRPAKEILGIIVNSI